MRALLLSSFAMLTLVACSPSTPVPAAAPTRNVDYRVTTTASTADRRFLVEFTSLSDRDICISANDWPTAEGDLGLNRTIEAGDQVQRVRAGDTLSAFVRFDQLTPEQRDGGVSNVDFALEPIFCGNGLSQ